MAAWRRARRDDLAAVDAIGDEVHPGLPERPEVFAEKFGLFPQGWVVLEAPDGTVQGYGIAHPWMFGEVPPLDAFLGDLPGGADCMFLHDCAIRPAWRGAGRMGGYLAHASGLARTLGIEILAGVSVYGTYRLLDRYGFRLEPGAVDPAKLAPYGPTARYVVAPPLKA